MTKITLLVMAILLNLAPAAYGTRQHPAADIRAVTPMPAQQHRAPGPEMSAGQKTLLMVVAVIVLYRASKKTLGLPPLI